MALSVKTKEHLRRRAAELLPKWGSLAACAAVLGLCIGYTGSSVHLVTIHDSRAGSERILASTDDVPALLRRVKMQPLAEYDVTVWSETPDGEELQVLRGYTTQVTADGETRQVVTTGETPAEILTRLGIAYDEDDIVTPAADEILPEGENIVLQRMEYVEYTVEETVAAPVEEIPTSLLYRKPEDSLTLREGVNGCDRVTYREVWTDGVWTATEVVTRETLAETVGGIVKVYGEQAPVSSFQGPEIVDGVPAEGVSEVYESQRSTAYSASQTAKGASGRRLTYGTVAVDPSVIPYGTLMYITSDDGSFVYGYAYAADTGAAMREGRVFVDLYYESYEESVKSAVIPVTVYIIDEETAAKYQQINDEILAADTVYGK